METIEELIEQETRKRLQRMAEPDYVFPEKADGKDYAAILAIIGISAILILLCAAGVIV